MYLTDAVKQRLKKIILPLMTRKCYVQGSLCRDRSIRLTLEEAKRTVTRYTDIPENPFVNEFKRLEYTTKDLSIVIPVYNSEKFLEKCLTSILNQTTDFSYEVICVNDGSHDNSLIILSDFKSKYGDKIVVIDQPNMGISVARNTGIEAAKGAYIGFMDNDDSVKEDYVDCLLKYAKEYNADIVQVGYTARDTNGIEHLQCLKRFIVSDNESVISEFCSGYIWSGIYKKCLWDKVRFPAGYWYEDMITRLLIMRLAKVYIMVDKPLYIKLIHPGNASVTLWNAANPKSVEAYYLAKYTADYGADCLGLENNRILMRQLIYEYSVQLRRRISQLPPEVQKALFLLAAHDICSRFNINLMKDNKLYTKIYHSFQRKCFKKWRYYSLALALASN